MRSAMAGMVLACMAFAPAAYGTEVASLDGAHLAKLVADAGYRAQLDRDGEDDPMVRSAAAGVNFQVYMYGCDEQDRCNAIHFNAGFDLDDGTTLEKVNEWNRLKRYGKAWLDEEGDPWLELDLALAGGGTEAQVREYVKLWDTLLGEFQAHLGF